MGLCGSLFECFRRFFTGPSATWAYLSSCWGQKASYSLPEIPGVGMWAPCPVWWARIAGAKGRHGEGVSEKRIRAQVKRFTHWPKPDTLCAGAVSVRNRGVCRGTKEPTCGSGLCRGPSYPGRVLSHPGPPRRNRACRSNTQMPARPHRSRSRHVIGHERSWWHPPRNPHGTVGRYRPHALRWW